MNSPLLSYYEAIERASADMLSAARAGDWDLVVRLEGACGLLISQLKQAARGETLQPVISGIRIYQSAAVNAGNMLVSNDSTAGWHEDGPFQIDDDDVAKLGRNVAVWGMGATAVYFPTAIYRLAAT